jgi:ATP-binding cassette subfamily F protein uup
VEAAGRLIDELEDRRARAATATAGIALAASGRRTRRLLAARGVTVARGDRVLASELDLVITPGTRVGLMGPNGSGKTTLLDVLAGVLPPTRGAIERADNLRIVRFEQDRGGALDPGQSLRRALAPEGDAVIWQGRSVHVAAWARRFLFRPEQLDVPVERLSGGEQARIRIARLMREPADLLLLDEPTNDLDIPTLEVLEDTLAEFDGGLVLVTHDRFMLERVCTLLVALDGTGGAATFADYAQWEAARVVPTATRPAGERPPDRERARPRRLGYLEQREWNGMEEAILAAESAAEACQRALEDPAVVSDPVALQARLAALDAARAEVDRLYARWAELEAKQS